ncbi:MAG: DUF255 domain-containing protein [Akkermansiaceae bacterium]
MNLPIFFRSASVVAIYCGLFLASAGCRKAERSEAVQSAVTARVLASEFASNGVGVLPGAVYQSQSKSPIHWQPWTRETMARAKDAKRLVFAVIAMPQQPGFQKILAEMAGDVKLVAVINSNYVPVLIDGEASREIGLLTADLCAEIKHGLQLPLLVWMTADANPVAWIPVPAGPNGGVAQVFNQCHEMVGRMWADDSEYVLKNSALDNANRRNRIAQRKNAKVMSETPAEDAVRALRQLSSFYDPYSRTFDEAGGLFPSGAIDLMATAAIHPGLPPEVRARSLDTTRELLVDLLSSAMFDPLEGGVFATRRGVSWALPGFFRDCAGQARAAVALLSAYRATKDPQSLEKALGLISFAEKSFGTPEGLFAIGMSVETDPAMWLWSVEDIEKELPVEDAAWWIKVNGMKDLGNLPSEVDLHREYFRSNSLAISKSMAALAADQGQPLEVFGPRFETARKQLLKVRNTRIGQLPRDVSAHAGSSFRMVSAYAAAFGVTGDVAFRDKAVALLTASREVFRNGSRLRQFTQDAPASVGEGRAFHYGLALQAALDVAVITSEESWLVWAEDLATTAAELFTDAEFLKECPDTAQIIDLPVTDLVMLFDESTAGLISFAECRLFEQKRPLVDSFSELATPLPTHAVDRPILHTDLLQATLARQFKVTVIAGPGISAEMKLALERLPMRMIQRSPSSPADGIPQGAVKVVFADGESRLVTTTAELEEAALP